MKKLMVIIVLAVMQVRGYSQVANTGVGSPATDSSITAHHKGQKLSTFIAPAILVGYGVLALDNKLLIDINHNIYDELQRHNSAFNSNLDNYLQYVPAISVYALDAVGVKAEHSLSDRSIILLTAAILEVPTVFLLKNLVREQRPNMADHLSFPSGHSANAFLGAEFLHREYAYKSQWFGVGGYIFAGATGIMRLYNNKHWLSDIVAAAGIGIIATKSAYALFPFIKRTFFKKKKLNSMIIPGYHAGNYQVTWLHTFNP